MTDEESRKLLLDAGVPEERIDAQAILIASTLGDAIARLFAKKIAKKIVEECLGEPEYVYQRPEGAVNFQSIKCSCGANELRFNQVPVTNCPKCGKVIDAEWPEDVI
jgi:hypothetical protein